MNAPLPAENLIDLPPHRVPKTRRERLAWIDLFRGAAVLVMIETHVVNTFLAANIRTEPWFAALNYLNGLVAPSFLFIAGFVQGMAWNIAPSKPVNFARRARHLLGIAAIGYALHYPWTEIAQHRWDDAMRIGSQVDVLQCIAAALGLLLAVTWLAQKIGGRRGERVWSCGLVALLLLAVLPAPLAATWNPAAIPLRAWLNFSTGSWFPLFPWAGFVFVGAVAGAAMRLGERSAENSVLPTPAASVSLPPAFASPYFRPSALTVAPLPLAITAWASHFAGHSPVSISSFLERTAWVLALAVLCQWLAVHRRLPSLVLFAGKHSLTLYVTHLVLISTLAGKGVPTNAFPVTGVLGLLAAIAPVSLAVTWVIAKAPAWARGRAGFVS